MSQAECEKPAGGKKSPIVTDRSDSLLSENEYLHAIIDSTNEGIFVINTDTWEIVDVNKTIQEMYGYTRDELVGVSAGAVCGKSFPYSQAEALEWSRKVHVSYICHTTRQMTEEEVFALAEIINSTIFNDYVRMINGSLNLSSYEFLRLPLP